MLRVLLIHISLLLPCNNISILVVGKHHPRLDPNEEVKGAQIKKTQAASVLPILTSEHAELGADGLEGEGGVPLPAIQAEKLVHCDLMKEFKPSEAAVVSPTKEKEKEAISPFKSMAQTRDIDVLYINLDRSIDRRESIERHLSMYGFRDHVRVRAVTPKELIIPHSISAPELCNKLTNDSIHGLTSSRAINMLSFGASGKASQDYRPLIITQCGRKKNTKGELTVTISHLKAMYLALKQNNNRKYALILEDDMRMAFDIDFSALVATAPPNFAILQLITSNADEVNQQFNKVYKASSGRNMWTLRGDHDFWCAGAYIINKEVMRPIVNGIVKGLGNGWIGHEIIAGNS